VKRWRALLLAFVAIALIAIYLRERGLQAEIPTVAPAVELVPLEPVTVGLGELRLSGRVHGPADESIAGATVSIVARSRPHWTTTDRDGRFELHELPSGRHDLRVHASGWNLRTLAAELPLAPEVSELAIELAQPPPLPALPPIQRALLSGALRDTRGEVLAGYELWLAPLADEPLLSGALERRDSTDELGLFRFEHLAAGRYRLVVLPAWARGGSWPVLHERELEHGPGATELNLEIERARVSGRVLDRSGAALEGALLVLRPAARELEPHEPERSDAQGAFSFVDLPAGRYALELHAGAASRRIEFELAAGAELELALEPIDPRVAD